MIITKKNLASLICALALLAFLMQATIADNSQNTAENITLNKTQNLTGNTPEEISKNDSQNSAQIATQIVAGNATGHAKVLRAGFEKTKSLKNLDVYSNKSTYNISSSTNALYKPLYNVSQYSRTKPLYEVPDTLSSKPVYSISGYPKIKAVNSIP
jgi:hypothetical protein